MLEIAVQNTLSVDLFESDGDLIDDCLGLLLGQLVNFVSLKVADEVATARELCYDVGFIVEFKLFDKVENVLICLAHVHCPTFTDLVFDAIPLVS